MTSDMDRHTILTGAAATRHDIRKAQIAAARNAASAEELELFLAMLGVRPGQDNPLWIVEP